MDSNKPKAPPLPPRPTSSTDQNVEKYTRGISQTISSSIHELDVHVVRVRSGQAELAEEVNGVFSDLHKSIVETETPQIDQALSRLAIVRKRLVAVNSSLSGSHNRLEKSITLLSNRQTVR
ncbi:hypothetical protein SmJEL517_g00928 [Synchytrium microbalum]|uniref:Biogenesis of lysosome-related organelles complex 1 subunit 7 n=1 Tax=Synchytrium microbalum TaxID=1806994 RepID=A0A507CGE5_9FUNG|nr:uncharacterized protein SmJEL517_g00928 [Synchytrium microbalum]TPX37096.1 hypothetical protein SmJEL517_g00928 [Synchytrium microbalum]